jgi:hypothetical protein
MVLLITNGNGNDMASMYNCSNRDALWFMSRKCSEEERQLFNNKEAYIWKAVIMAVSMKS